MVSILRGDKQVQRCKTCLLATVVILAVCQLTATLGCSSRDELAEIRAADQAYATAWLTNDSEHVMATLAANAVIMPSGMPAIQGEQAIREFWWPEDSTPTNVTEFTLRQVEVGRDNFTGHVRGSFSLTFEYGGEIYSSEGEYLCLFKRTGDSWKISHRMWNDRPQEG